MGVIRRWMLLSMFCPSGTETWAEIIPLYYCFLEDKARIDIGGPLSETEREGIYLAEKLLEIKET